MTAAIFGCEGLRLGAVERDFFRDAAPFGFILFGRNVQDPDQLRRLTAELRAAVGRDAPVLVDQEGGRVQRLRGPHWAEWSPPLDAVQKAGSVAGAARVMALRATLIARDLRAVGIDANCAPVADVATALTHPFLRNRCYGTDPATVAAIARAVADAHLATGVLPVIKHLPGHGRAQADTHHHLPLVDADRATLDATDFAPFRHLADLPMAMTAHIVFAAYDADLPATQSPGMIRVIREEIGFQGLLLTDDLSMQALSGSLAERAARAMAAGCDIALHCNGDLAEMRDVAAATGPLRPEGARRAQAALDRRIAAPPFDADAALAALAALGQGPCDGG